MSSGEQRGKSLIRDRDAPHFQDIHLWRGVLPERSTQSAYLPCTSLAVCPPNLGVRKVLRENRCKPVHLPEGKEAHGSEKTTDTASQVISTVVAVDGQWGSALGKHDTRPPVSQGKSHGRKTNPLALENTGPGQTNPSVPSQPGADGKVHGPGSPQPESGVTTGQHRAGRADGGSTRTRHWHGPDAGPHGSLQRPLLRGAEEVRTPGQAPNATPAGPRHHGPRGTQCDDRPRSLARGTLAGATRVTRLLKKKSVSVP